MFLDIHGHSKKKGSFMYGPYFPLHTNTYFNIRLLPKLLAEKSPIFRFYSCRFKTEKRLRQSARLVMSQNFGIKYTYTMENSLFGYIDSERITHAFKLEDFNELAKLLLKSIHQFSKMLANKNNKKDKSKIKEENYLNENIEREKDHQSSSESDSQSESEEECLEAKNNVVRAIKKFKRNIDNKNLTPHINKQKSKSNKRLKSQNPSGIAKNLPDLSKKQMITSKVISVDKSPGKIPSYSSSNITNKIMSLNDSIINGKQSLSPSIDLQNKSLQKITLASQNSKYSKINLFELFDKRKAEEFLESSQFKYKRTFNFPSFFSKPMKNN